MSELKPCAHCGNGDHLIVERVEGETVSPDNFQVVCSWLSGGCGASGGVRRTQAEAIEAWNRRADDATCKAKQAVDKQADSREQLEADIDREFKENYKGTHAERHYTRELIVGWLDRQATITEREICAKCEWPSLAAMPDLEQQERIKELEAEVESLKRANRIQADSFLKIERELAEARAK